MTSDTDLPHKPDTIHRQPLRFFKQLKQLALIATVVLIVIIAGISRNLLEIRKNQSMPQNTASQNAASPIQEPVQLPSSTRIPTISLTATSTLQVQQPSISPDTVLQTYYNWYLACQNYHSANANAGTANKSPQEDCPYNKTGLLTSELVTDFSVS